MPARPAVPFPELEPDVDTVLDALTEQSRRPRLRGVCLAGRFVPTGAAEAWTTAPHLRAGADVHAVARFSPGHGGSARAGAAPVGRGMAVRFSVGDVDTDLVSLDVPVFVAPTPAAFLDLTRALAREHGPDRRAAVARYLARRPAAVPAFRALARRADPAGYATARYWAIHAFLWHDRSWRTQAVRYRWDPESAPGGDAGRTGAGPSVELYRRLGRGRVRFRLRVQLAAGGDDTADPCREWPADRPEIDAGVLELRRPVRDPSFWDAQVFDPARLPDGIVLSDDPVLGYRSDLYARSAHRRARERSTPPGASRFPGPDRPS